jgi:hypothetical protein
MGRRARKRRSRLLMDQRAKATSGGRRVRGMTGRRKAGRNTIGMNTHGAWEPALRQRAS